MDAYFDGQPFGFRFANPRTSEPADAHGPLDDLGGCEECGGRTRHERDCWKVER